MSIATLMERLKALRTDELVERYQAAKEDAVLKAAFDAELKRRGLK